MWYEEYFIELEELEFRDYSEDYELERFEGDELPF